MTTRRLLSLPTTLSLVLALATSCSRKEDDRKGEHPVDTRAAEAAIRNASDDWGKAMTARDVDKTISFYADGGSYFPNRQAIIDSKDGLRKYWAQLLALPGPGLTCDTTRVEVARSGELAYETGTCELTTKDLKGKSTTEKQKYVVVWKKQKGGSWKAVVDIDNTD
jgi:ketosteroid isomerase-like protein